MATEPPAKAKPHLVRLTKQVRKIRFAPAAKNLKGIRLHWKAQPDARVSLQS
jgi:hypothetical protein